MLLFQGNVNVKYSICLHKSFIGIIMKKINSDFFLAGSTIECDGVTGIGT